VNAATVRSRARARRVAVFVSVLSPLVAISCSSAPNVSVAGPTGSPPAASQSQAPANQVAAVCGKEPPGPAAAPAGAVTVDPAVPGDLITKVRASPPGTTFWLAPGTHRFSDGQYDQVTVKDGDSFIGAPGAVLDGRKLNQYAFTGQAKNVHIEHLTVQGFVAPLDEGVVNHDSGDGWVIEDNTIQDNGGAGLMAGAGQQVIGNCLKDNGQYGMNAFSGSTPITHLVLKGNEITGNNTDDWESKKEGCGCTGGVKFWAVNGADITGNWVHDNRGPGLWADTNNNDFLISGNVIENNDSSAILYEISYNAVIQDNTIRGNNIVAGRKAADKGDTFPYATIYISESGGEPRIPARTNKIDIHGNLMQDNWAGITLWENADRFCNSPANTSSGDCTLLVPKVGTCVQPAIAKAPLYDDCRWKTQNVDIHNNRFVLDPTVVACDKACSWMALLSNYGTYPDWSPYKGDIVQQAITTKQHNTWRDNTYTGPWNFMVHDTSNVLDGDDWQGSTHQDQGSTFARAAGG
jgi:hypothetical protein